MWSMLTAPRSLHAVVSTQIRALTEALDSKAGMLEASIK